MSGLLAALGGPLLGAAGSVIGGVLANQESASSAQKQMDFQERMSDTQYQRTVSDMKAAGLNPMLAAFSGQPVSSPSGSSYTAQNPASGLVSAGQSVADSLKVPSQISQIDALTSLANAQKTSESYLQGLRMVQSDLAAAQKDVATASAKGLDSDNVAKAAMSRLWQNHPMIMQILNVLQSQSGNIATAAKTLSGVMPIPPVE